MNCKPPSVIEVAPELGDRNWPIPSHCEATAYVAAIPPSTPVEDVVALAVVMMALVPLSAMLAVLSEFAGRRSRSAVVAGAAIARHSDRRFGVDGPRTCRAMLCSCDALAARRRRKTPHPPVKVRTNRGLKRRHLRAEGVIFLGVCVEQSKDGRQHFTATGRPASVAGDAAAFATLTAEPIPSISVAAAVERRWCGNHV